MDAVVQTKSVENSASLGSIFRLSESGDLIRLDHDQVSEYGFLQENLESLLRILLKMDSALLLLV